MRKRLATQCRGKNLIGTVILDEIYAFYDLHKDENIVRERELIEGYVKHDKYFVRTQDLGLRIKMYRDKPALIKAINEKLASLGYSWTISEIFFKS